MNKQLISFAQKQVTNLVKDTTQFMYAKQAASIVSIMYPSFSPYFWKREDAFIRIHTRLLREQRLATIDRITQELMNKESSAPHDILVEALRIVERDDRHE